MKRFEHKWNHEVYGLVPKYEGVLKELVDYEKLAGLEYDSEESGELHEFIAGLNASPEDDMQCNEMMRDVENALSTLNNREQLVLRLYFGIGSDEHTLNEIAERLHVSRTRIAQIRDKALRRLRHPSKSDALIVHTY